MKKKHLTFESKILPSPQKKKFAKRINRREDFFFHRKCLASEEIILNNLIVEDNFFFCFHLFCSNRLMKKFEMNKLINQSPSRLEMEKKKIEIILDSRIFFFLRNNQQESSNDSMLRSCLDSQWFWFILSKKKKIPIHSIRIHYFRIPFVFYLSNFYLIIAINIYHLALARLGLVLGKKMNSFSSNSFFLKRCSIRSRLTICGQSRKKKSYINFCLFYISCERKKKIRLTS